MDWETFVLAGFKFFLKFIKDKYFIESKWANAMNVYENGQMELYPESMKSVGWMMNCYTERTEKLSL